MQKKLFKIGNSVALVIDKSLRNALGIKATTLVRVTTDGSRIIIEPNGERTVEQLHAIAVTGKTRALAIASDLLRNWHVSNDRFAEVCAGWNRPNVRLRIMHYGMWCERVDWHSMSPAEQRLIRRFDVLHTTLCTGAYWEHAVTAALTAEPFDPLDSAECRVGEA